MSAPPVHPFELVGRVLSERLQRRVPSEQLRAMVTGPGTDWDGVLGLASAQFVLPAFAAALRDLGLLGLLDEELGAFLEAVHAANLERNNELRDELALAVDILNRAGIEPVLLKGAIRLIDDLYPDDGWRMLRDLDLLVPEAMMAEAVRAFGKVGYAPCALHNEVRRNDGACQIDLHMELFSGSTQLHLLPAKDVLNASRPSVLQGGSVRIPSVEHQLVHLIGHSQIRHRGHASGCIGLRDQLEAAALVHRGHDSIDWQAVDARFATAGHYRPLLSFVLALRRGAWCAVPVADRIDRITALQQRRIRLQARSATFGYISSRVGWWVSEFRSQIKERDAGRRRAVTNVRRLVSERGAIRRMARALLDRHSHLMHVLPYVSWFLAQ